MKVECRVIANVGYVPYWIKKEVYDNHFDQQDARLLFPDVLTQGYLIEWFSCEKGVLSFNMSRMDFVKGKTQFANGRHRAALLFEHLDEVPIAFKTDSDEEKHLLEMIPKRPVESGDRIFVPDLPIWKDGEALKASEEDPILLSRWAADPKIRNEMKPLFVSQDQTHTAYTYICNFTGDRSKTLRVP